MYQCLRGMYQCLCWDVLMFQQVHHFPHPRAIQAA